MDPSNVYVVFNNGSDKIEGVYAEQFMADRACDKIRATRPQTGLYRNEDKYKVMGLDDAIMAIEKFYHQYHKSINDSSECD